MPRFRKKPVVVDATQWLAWNHAPSRKLPVVAAPEIKTEGQCGYCGRDHIDHGWVDTLEGGHIVCPNDWIVTGVFGETYPVKPDNFDATYEPVSDDA